ncbi:hypothetical protein TNCT_120931 [Trichonephila clavata]|uniref:Uncharacterized protein n=1 Tax=Trichonephila clavata TaxID=2740835 RepID=A0A8X6HGT2_TRICU|nr:hypothetical protein TNCT_120931 [Trichonephila clavata]
MMSSQTFYLVQDIKYFRQKGSGRVHTYSGSVKSLRQVRRKLFSDTPSPDMTRQLRISKPEKLMSMPFPKGKLNPENSSSEESSLKRPRKKNLNED